MTPPDILDKLHENTGFIVDGAVFCQKHVNESLAKAAPISEVPLEAFPTCSVCQRVIERGVTLSDTGLRNLAMNRLYSGMGRISESGDGFAFHAAETGRKAYGNFASFDEAALGLGRWIQSRL